ncbi:hypothetical protein HY837_05310 [archaeon]|nr:hypothetical protein [archaeon]
MRDIWEENLLCTSCNSKTEKIVLSKDNFNIRTWKCKSCKKSWPHPLDYKKFEGWKEIKDQRFNVKIREVGNSAVVSLPREILSFKEIKMGEEAAWKFRNSEELILEFRN